jgi:hypothetical protein
MSFTQATLLISAVFAVTTMVDKAIPALTGWKLQLVAFVIGVGTTFLVAYSSYASSVKVGGKALDTVNTAALILIGLMIAGGATVTDRLFRAVSNVGENIPADNVPPN